MSTIDERAARLRDRGRQDYAEKWDFNELPEICGIVESIDVVQFTEGPVVVATVQEPESGVRRSIWLSQTALFNRFRDLRISPGELVYVRYIGEADHHEKGKSPAKRFRVEVDRAGQAFDWRRVGEITGGGDDTTSGNGADVSREEHEAAVDAYAATAAPTGDEDIPF